MRLDFYKACEHCGWSVDDGQYKNDKYLCQECFDPSAVDYSNLTKRRLFLIATDSEMRMSNRYAAVKELQNRRLKN